MDRIIIVDFGSQFTQLIAKKIRSLQTYCEIIPFHQAIPYSDEVIGIVLAGSPASVTQKDSPQINVQNIVDKNIPILGICYGAQLIASQYGGKIISSKREYGKAHFSIEKENILLQNIPPKNIVWMSHGDSIEGVEIAFDILGSTQNQTLAAFAHKSQKIWCLQFHPEVHHSQFGLDIFRNFIQHICKGKQDWTPSSFVESSVQEIQEMVGNKKVLMALSGGVDSTVAASLIHKAIGRNLQAVFVNNGLLRKNEFEQVLSSYKRMGLQVEGVDARTTFYQELKNITDPETKRKIIGRLFIETFEDVLAHQKDKVYFLGQGTTYPDIIESVAVFGPSVTIKSHHNVGGLPAKMNLQVLEPIRFLFKDEVRKIGMELGVPEEIVFRHPFPGPGLAIRILGEVTEERIDLIQAVDDIFISSLKEKKLYDKVWQAGAILLPTKTVGVMGDERTYENVVALRAVTSVDGMTADWAMLPYDFLSDVSTKIINEVRGVNRVVYDISSKPPATIEWE